MLPPVDMFCIFFWDDFVRPGGLAEREGGRWRGGDDGGEAVVAALRRSAYKVRTYVYVYFIKK